jgi:rare lipoprotein A
MTLLATVAALGVGDTEMGAEAKTPGQTYCFLGTCHRVKSIAETEALVGTEETLEASFYDSCHRDPNNPCGLTSSGEVFRPDAADNAASPVYPDGTKLLIWSPHTHETVVVRVNNAGPYWGKRKLDVSRAAADRLGFMDRGVATLMVRVLDAPDPSEATYKEGRTYDPVPGYIGQYASFDAARTAMEAGAAGEVFGVLRPAPTVVLAAAVVGTTPVLATVATASLAPADGAAKVSLGAKSKASLPAERQRSAKSRSQASRLAAQSRRARASRYAALNTSPRTARRNKGTLIATAGPAATAERKPGLTAEAPMDISVFSRFSSPATSQVASRVVFSRKSAARWPARPATRAT